MKHLGDIKLISGYTAPIVDCIIGGSPCQDLSVANGKREGLNGERSGLFMEQIRIIKEMRDSDRRIGRTEFLRPRYMVWENVPGAFSSNKGEDFRVVLEETARVADPEVSIPRPEKGKWTTNGCILGNGWSIAWRVFDAQFWGVPQRRRRIALVADFGGQSAPEILFVRKSLQGNSQPSRTKRKDYSADIERGIASDNIERAIVFDARGNGDGKTVPTITGDHENRITDYTGVVCYRKQSHPRNADEGQGWEETDKSDSINTFDNTEARTPIVCLQSNQWNAGVDDKGICFTLTASMGMGGGYVHMITDVVSLDRASYNQGINAQYDMGISENGVAHTVIAKGPGAVAYVEGIDGYNASLTGDKSMTITGARIGVQNIPCIAKAVDLTNMTETEVNGTLQSCMAHNTHSNNVVRINYIVRRLTPLECERLQGYPDYWTDIGEFTDTKGKKCKTSDSARYKALGNSIALPSWKWVIKRLCGCYERDATMASLFDGIGGFPLCWEQINGKGSCLWASEIEEFPIAVTKERIG